MSLKKKSSMADIKSISHPFLWKHLSQNDITKLDLLSPEEVEKYISELHNLVNYTTDLVDGSLVDYYVTHYWWAAKLKNFIPEQTSVYYSIAYTLLDNLLEKHLSATANILEFENILSNLNQGSKLFNDEQIKEISEQIFTSIFQHYKMYEFIVYDSQTDYVVSKEIDVECPIPPDLPYPPPLDEALPEELYNKCILKISDSTENKENIQTSEQKLEEIVFNEEAENQLRSMFDGLTVENAKRMIYEVTNDMLADLKIEMRKALKEREAALINEVSKVSVKAPKN